MATLTQTRRRSPLYVGTPALSYNHRTDAVEVAMRSDTETPGGKGTWFNLELSRAEFERVEQFMRDLMVRHDFKPTEACAESAANELDKDARHNLSKEQQAAKALDFAFTMLKAFMPHGEQDGNSTLAYIGEVSKLNPYSGL